MKTGFARSLMHVDRAVVRVRDRTWTFSTTSKCLKRHSPRKKSVKREEISTGEFFSPKLLHISSRARQRPLSWKWRTAHVCFGLLTCGPLLNFHDRFFIFFYYYFVFNVIFCSGLWLLQRVAGRQLTNTPI